MCVYVTEKETQFSAVLHIVPSVLRNVSHYEMYRGAPKYIYAINTNEIYLVIMTQLLD